MQHHNFIKATLIGVAPKDGHATKVGPTSSATSAGSLLTRHLARKLGPSATSLMSHLPCH